MAPGPQAEFAAALLEPTRPPPAGLVAWNGSDPARRFAVYRNNVVVGLVEALAKSFPAVRRLVGAEFFAALATEYLRAAPPRSPILAEYGATFGDFLVGFPPVAELPYLPDVARLEFAMLEAFHAADAPAGGIELLAGIGPDGLDAQRFSAHPAARLVESRFAIVRLVTANRAVGEVPPIDAGLAEGALVTRPALAVVTTRLGAGGIALARGLLAGNSLGEAAAAALAVEPGCDLGQAIGALFAAGAFMAPSALNSGE